MNLRGLIYDTLNHVDLKNKYACNYFIALIIYFI